MNTPTLQTLLWLCAFFALLLVAAILWSHLVTPETGMHHGQLRACDNKPHCVCSEEHEDDEHHVEPLMIADGEDPQHGWQRFLALLGEQPGITIEARTQSDIYVHATATTPLLHFVDDLEARLDLTGRRIHLRSASRVGHSDLGANRRRVEALRQQWNERGS